MGYNAHMSPAVKTGALAGVGAAVGALAGAFLANKVDRGHEVGIGAVGAAVGAAVATTLYAKRAAAEPQVQPPPDQTQQGG